MQHVLLFRCLFLVLTLCCSTATYAWGAKAHLVIGMLAAERLTPATRAAVAEILGNDDLAAATLWADDMRDTRTKTEFWTRYAASWHYVNIDRGGDYNSSAKNPRGDAYAALQTFVAILLDEPVPAGPVRTGLDYYFGGLDTDSAEVKRFALKFLLHIIGDLQQPLHSGYAHDRGGNAVKLSWFKDTTNLHTLWDSQLLDSQQRTTAEIARDLSARIGRTPASDVRRSESADPQLWIQECQQLLERIYAKHSRTNNFDDAYSGDAYFGNAYAAEFVPTVEAQLVKGGLRTAYLLNSIFDGRPTGPP